MVRVSGFGVWGWGFGVWGLGLVRGSGFGVQGSGRALLTVTVLVGEVEEGLGVRG